MTDPQVTRSRWIINRRDARSAATCCGKGACPTPRSGRTISCSTATRSRIRRTPLDFAVRLRPRCSDDPGDRLRHGGDDSGDRTSSSAQRLSRHRGAFARRRQPAQADRREAARQHPHHPTRCCRRGGANDSAREPGRDSHFFPRSLAQEAPSQAPADPAAVRAAARLASGRRAATSIWPPTGRTTPSRCWTCWRTSRYWRTPPPGSRPAPTTGR